MEEVKNQFYESLLKAQQSKRGNSVSLTGERYVSILQALTDGDPAVSSTLDPQTLRRYEVFTVDGEPRLIRRRSSLADPVLCFAANEDVYSIIREHHLSLGHGGIVRTYASVSRKMANITREMVELFIEMCLECTEKRSRSAHPFYNSPSKLSVTPSPTNNASALDPKDTMENLMPSVTLPVSANVSSAPSNVIGARQQNMAAILNSLSDRQKQQAKVLAATSGERLPLGDARPASATGSDEDINGGFPHQAPLPPSQGSVDDEGSLHIDDRDMMQSLSPNDTDNSSVSPSQEHLMRLQPGSLGPMGIAGPLSMVTGGVEGQIKQEGVDSPDVSEMYYAEDDNDIAISDNTLKANLQAVKMFKDCLTSRGMSVDLTTYTKEELASALKHFYSGLRKRDGGCYKMNTLHVFRSGINRHLANVDIVNDIVFKDANQVFHAQIAEARRTRRDNSEQSPLLSEDDFNRIYNNVVFDLSNPKTLQWKVFFDAMLYLHRRGDNIKMMTRDTFCMFEEDEKRYVTFMPPSNDGNRMYEIPGDPLCPVKSFEKYLSKLHPESPWLWQKPKRSFIPSDPCWYEPQPLMFHRPYQLISAICKYAGLSRQYSPQSILVPGAIFVRKRQPGGGVLRLGGSPSLGAPLGAPPMALPFLPHWGPFVHGDGSFMSGPRDAGMSHALMPPLPPAAGSFHRNGHSPSDVGRAPSHDEAGAELVPGIDYMPSKYRRLNTNDGERGSGNGASAANALAVGVGSGLGERRPDHMEPMVSSSQSPPGGMPSLASCIEYYIRDGSLFCCEHCGILFLERSTMFLHKGLHGTDQKWQCSVCKQTCSSRNEFTLHIINHLHRK